MMNPENGKSDLDWLAFRYIAGEMSIPEADEFESRLACEQAAREAVASAVRLSRAVVAAGPLVNSVVPQPSRLQTSPAGTYSRQRQRRTVVSLLAVVCLMAALSLFLDRSERPAGADHLVAGWTDARMAFGGESDVLADRDSLAAGEDQLMGEEGVVVPDWLLAAVATDASGDESDQEQMEN